MWQINIIIRQTLVICSPISPKHKQLTINTLHKTPHPRGGRILHKVMKIKDLQIFPAMYPVPPAAFQADGATRRCGSGPTESRSRIGEALLRQNVR